MKYQPQVPLHLCTAVTKVSQQAPKTTGVLAAVSLLRKFLSATKSSILAPTPSDTTPLQSSMLQQYEASGLPQQLPAVLTAAAEELSAQARDKSFIRYGQILAAGAETHQIYAFMIRHHAEQLLEVHSDLCWLWPDGVQQVIARTHYIYQLEPVY